ncbi:MAG: sigma-70 family RNA polymerase sigma factor [Bryobacteraceae bacterium]|nr:sigma-70 family RNA polymerase sigma factor [Bryobacteraceae bacterium]
MTQVERGAGFPMAAVPAAGPPDLETLFREYHSLVFRAAYRVTGSAADAEDVLQTVFLRLSRRDADAEPMTNVEGYLRRAAVNAAVDLIRSRQAARAVAIDDVAPQHLTQSAAESPERAVRSGEIRGWLRQAVSKLSPRAAEIFVLRFIEGKENPEIAEMVGTTTATVAVTLHRTRERLANEFKSYMGERS